jgi:peptidoglycan/xylan/chitin deacetylase (PgdA/CDA1 family)
VASIEIVICVTGRGDGVRRSLDAVSEQGCRAVWLATAADGGRERAGIGGAASASTMDVRVLSASGPGLAGARNAALAASDAAVLAFLEDDVVVAPGWLAALREGWDGAPDRVAAIGGPIELRLPGATPRWFGDELHPSFATLDYGPAPLVLDPASRTLHAGNLSVRSAPLRAIGGFWPAPGHRDGRDWFSDEHHAQRELAQAGWEVRYEPAARASRVPDPRTLRPDRLLLRRLRFGARMAVAGAPQPVKATISQAVSSGGGAVVALARRQPALAVERGARAAQSTGLLIGRPIAARDFRAVGPRPFASRIPPAPAPPRRTRASTRQGSGSAAILLYHRVSEPTSASGGMCVSPEHFEQQMQRLRGRPVLGLDELAGLARERLLPPDAIAVTFDDGYEDIHSNAQPRLAAAGIPATVFVSTGHVAQQRPFYWDELERLLLGGGSWPTQLELSFPDGRRAWRTETPAQREQARCELHHLIQPASPRLVEDVLAQLAGWARDGGEHASPRAMTIDELRALIRHPLMTVGAHTRRHANLAFQCEQAQREEIEGSRDDLCDWLGSAPSGFAYPFGIAGVDFDETTSRLVADAGFDYAVVNQAGAVDARSDRFALPRHFVPDVGGAQFSDWLDEVLRG